MRLPWHRDSENKSAETFERLEDVADRLEEATSALRMRVTELMANEGVADDRPR